MSVSTGSLLLAAAGLLTDREASGHWLASGELEAAGAHPSEEPGHLDGESGHHLGRGGGSGGGGHSPRAHPVRRSGLSRYSTLTWLFA